jgi:hypothetical protein
MALLAFFEEKTWCIGAIAGGRAFVRGRSSVGVGWKPRWWNGSANPTSSWLEEQTKGHIGFL